MNAFAIQKYLGRDEKVAIGKRIRTLRVIRDLTGEVFAATIGTTQGTLAGWEVRAIAPRTSIVSQICRTYGVSADWLLFGEQLPFDRTEPGDETPGSRLREFRATLELSGDLFARTLGTSAATLSVLENDKAPIPLRIIFCLSEAYGLRADWLLLGRQPVVRKGVERHPNPASLEFAANAKAQLTGAALKAVFARTRPSK